MARPTYVDDDNAGRLSVLVDPVGGRELVASICAEVKDLRLVGRAKRFGDGQRSIV